MIELFRNHRVVNWHEHIWSNESGKRAPANFRHLMHMADVTHTDVLVCSNPFYVKGATPEQFIHCNNVLYESMCEYPGRIRGMCYVNPGYRREALAEIERCVLQLGFTGVKLYNQYHLCDPVLEDVIRQCIALDIPILCHAGKLNHCRETQPFISDGTHFARAAEKFPDAVFVYAHIGGGGDWQWSLKAIAPYPNVFADTSGSVCDEGILEESVRLLGADRLLFGSDMSYSANVGKILAARIPEEDKITILDNPRFHRYLERR